MANNYFVDLNSTLDHFGGNISKQPVQLQSWTDVLFRLQFDTKSLGATNMCYFFEQKWSISLYYAAAYLVLVFLGHNWMKSRKPYNLRTMLGIWSGSLSLFSFIGTFYVWPEFIQVFREKGFVGTYCDNGFIYNNATFYWYTMFTLSKIPELIDTGFIVLRKQKLILLHWIHHALTLVFTFYVYADQIGSARWMVSMNFAVHAFMYGYYCLKAFHVYVPRQVSVAITASQIIQMIFGLVIHSHSLLMQIVGNAPAGCQCTFRTSVAGFLMYLMYFYFFVEFFVKAYLSKKPSSKHVSSTSAKSNLNGTSETVTTLNGKYSDSNNNTVNNSHNAHYCNGDQLKKTN